MNRYINAATFNTLRYINAVILIVIYGLILFKLDTNIPFLSNNMSHLIQETILTYHSSTHPNPSGSRGD